MPALGTHTGACSWTEWILHCMDPTWQGRNCWAAWILYYKDPVLHGKPPGSSLEWYLGGNRQAQGVWGSER